MSDKNIPTDKPSKEKSYNLVKTIMDNSNMKEINVTPNYISQLQIPQDKNLNGKLNPENNINKGKNNIIAIMKDMKTKISNNNLSAIKTLLDTQTISQQSKNQLLNFSFIQLYLYNNNIQKQIIVEFIEHGADSNYKLKFDINEKNITNNYSIPKNIKLTPLIFCCIKGDYELFELIKNKINLSTNYEENNSYSINKNYFFYFFENNHNVENKYKIAKSILQKNKENKNIQININDYDKKTGMTLLMLSVVRQYTNFIKLLLENGADINLKNLIDGDTALHYAAKIKNKKIIELLIENEHCDLLIKNYKNETVIDVANYNSANTEIYSLLAQKYGEQQKLFEEKNIQDKNKINKVDKNKNNINGINENKKANGQENNNKEKNTKETYILQENQVKRNIHDLNSYIEIPFHFVNNQVNYIEYYDANNKNKTENGINEVELNNVSREEEKECANFKKYMKFKGTPILNINLKSKEDEDLLILDNLKAENEEYDAEFEEIEKKLEKLYKEHDQLLNELSEVNNEIKSVNKKIDSYSEKIQEKENKYVVVHQKLKNQEEKQNSILDVLLHQKKFLDMNKNNQNFNGNMYYLNKKFSEEFFDDKYIQDNLQKDILDFQLYVKSKMKQRIKSSNKIRSSIQEILEINGHEYTVYIFGSYNTGLCLPQSDLDLILYNRNQSKKYDRDYSKEKLIEIQSLLSGQNWINNPTLVSTYKAFPYLKFSTDEKYGYMKVNLTIQDKTNKGYECVNLTNRFLNSYKNMEPLVLVLKYLLKLSNNFFSLFSYCDNGKENINSYSIILMVAFFFQYQIMQTNVEYVNNQENLGKLFINFLKYYNTYEQKEKGFVFPRVGMEDILENDDFLQLKQSNSNLVIIDPLNHKNNAFPENVDFKNVKIIFTVILNSSRIKCDCSCHYLKDNYNTHGNNGNDKPFELGSEHCILKRMFKTARRINPN